MPEARYKVLAVATHPVQYMAPIFRRMAADPRLALQVAYCSMKGAKPGFDPDFQTSVQWDIPLLDGYQWTEVPNNGSGNETFFGLNNPGLVSLIRNGSFDAVLCYVGYVRASFWIARRAAKSSRAAFIFGTDAHSLVSRDGKAWKVWLKRLLWPMLFRQADQVIVPSAGTFDLMKSLGICERRISVTPYSIDNSWWKSASAKVDRAAIRSAWSATPTQPVVLFCAKMQPWKRPMDLLCAFSDAHVPDSLLVFAGDGPQRAELEAEVVRLGLQQRVRLLGFVNQSGLPALYTSADVMVLPSSYEPFAVVVNESMCCGCPVIASDQVGAARDLVAPVRPEFVFRTGDTKALAQLLRTAFANPAELCETGRRAFEQVETHSPERVVQATIEAIGKAVERMRHEN